MAQIDTQMEHFTEQQLASDPYLSAEVLDGVSDDELLLSHVMQGDHELYALHCLLCDGGE